MESWEFCRILSNLLDNAMDAAQEAPEGCVKLRLFADDVGIHFHVMNNGTPIEAANLERVFVPGFTTKGGRGTGMGLFIVRNLVHRFGGEIVVTSTEQQTCFAGYVRRGDISDTESDN